jgi:phosphomannomutase
MATDLDTMAEISARAGARFGTSGVRGLVTALTDRVCFGWALAFLDHLTETEAIGPGTPLALGRDRRPSSARIVAALAAAARHRGVAPVDAGLVPTPALAGWAMSRRWPCIMVTGSHIPADRNGLKLYRPDGEIDKADEVAIGQRRVELPAERFDDRGAWIGPPPEATREAAAEVWYRARFRDAFGPEALAGLRVGAYGHCAVGRGLTATILADLGAAVTRLGDRADFIALDTEAIDDETREAAHRWAREGGFDAIVSTDADGDRPLVAHERGEWLRGDQIGLLAARQLGAEIVVTPVSTTTAVERTGWFGRVVRTKVGSPHVIAAMAAHRDEGRVVGFEANGGVLVGSTLTGPAGPLLPLPTRDAIVAIVAVLARAQAAGAGLSTIEARLPARFTASDRLEHVDRAASAAHLAEIIRAGPAGVVAKLGPELGPVEAIDDTDGVRVTFASGEIVHLRPSGNAPELRCYAEADDPARAQQLVAHALEHVRGWS